MIFCMAISVSQSSDSLFACPTLNDRSPRNTAHDDIWYRCVHTPLGIETKNVAPNGTHCKLSGRCNRHVNGDSPHSRYFGGHFFLDVLVDGFLPLTTTVGSIASSRPYL